MNNKKIITILGISIICNALFIGIFMGKMIYRSHNPEFIRSHNILSLEEKKDHHEMVKNAHDELEEVIMREPYNEKLVFEAFLEFDKKMSDMRKTLYKKIAEKAGQLSLHERFKLLPPPLPNNGRLDHKDPRYMDKR